MVLKGAHSKILAREAQQFHCGNYEWSIIPVSGDIDTQTKGGNTWNSNSDNKESLPVSSSSAILEAASTAPLPASHWDCPFRSVHKVAHSHHLPSVHATQVTYCGVWFQGGQKTSDAIAVCKHKA